MISYLSSLLKPSQCAQCKFCCLFERPEAWETPLFSSSEVTALKKKYGSFDVKAVGHSFTLDLENIYKTKSDEELAPCPFLDSEKGCVLSDEEKPFDCKIWPLRIMKKENNLVIALTPTCVELNKVPFEDIKSLVVDNGLGELIFDKAEKMQDMIKDYRDGFPVLMIK